MLANPLRINQIDYDFLDKKFATVIVNLLSNRKLRKKFAGIRKKFASIRNHL